MPPRYLDPKVKVVWFLPSLAALLVIWVIATVFAFVGVEANYMFGMAKPLFSAVFLLALLAVIGIPVFIWNHIEYMSFTFELAEHEFVIRQGIITRETTVIPYNRIQNINTTRSIVERLLGLATLSIETAGTNPTASEGYLPGISKKDTLINEIMARVERIKKSMLKTSPENKSEKQLLGEILKELSELNNNLQHLAGSSPRLEQFAKAKNLGPPKPPTSN